jgi:urocanate hydratase
LGSDQTSLHNPWAGGYNPTGITFDEANDMMTPELFKSKVQETLRRHTNAINKHTAKELISLIMEMLLLEASRAGATIMAENNVDFRYLVMYKT